MKFRISVWRLAAFVCSVEMILPSAGEAQAVKFKIPMVRLDSVFNLSTQQFLRLKVDTAWFGLHMDASNCSDTNLSGFSTHWSLDDTLPVAENILPPVAPSGDIRFTRPRTTSNFNCYPLEGLQWDIRRFVDTTQRDTFKISATQDMSEPSETHRYTFTWPSVLASYFDSCIFVGPSLSAVAPLTFVDMNRRSIYHLPTDPDTGGQQLFNLLCVGPKVPPPPAPVQLTSPADGAIDQPFSLSITWAAAPGALYYLVQVAKDSNFTPAALIADDSLGPASLSKSLAGLLQAATYYWHVAVATSNGVSYFQNPSFRFTTDAPGTISGATFNDANANGVRDGGETGLSGWKIYLKNSQNVILDSTLTAITGAYVFADRFHGSYIVYELPQDDWLQTGPSGMGMYELTISGGSSHSGKDFGNVPALKYVGPPTGNWSESANWPGGHPPGPTDPVVIPSNVQVTVDALPSDNILALRIAGGGTLAFSSGIGKLTATSVVRIDNNATVTFSSLDEAGGLVCYDDLVNSGTINPGHSTITFAGNRPKSIVSAGAGSSGSTPSHHFDIEGNSRAFLGNLSRSTSFYNLEIEGDSTASIGNLSIGHRLVLDRSLEQRFQDTVFVDNDSSGAISGPGGVSTGTIHRTIMPLSTDPYRFESPDTYLRFTGAGTNPAIVAVTARPNATISTGNVVWQVMGGTVDSLQHTITADSVGHFSKWVVGRPRPTSSLLGDPGVSRLYTIDATGGSAYIATVQLRYEQAEVYPGLAQGSLRLLRGPFPVDTVEAKWNIVSLPVIPDNNLKESLFPTSISNAFSYSGSGYQTQSHLLPRVGYWLKFPSSTEIAVVGDEHLNDSVNVSSGWNLIGSSFGPLAASSLSSIPGSIITSPFFGFSGQYKVVDSLKPLRGYWVKTSSAGKLLLSGLSNAISRTQATITKELETLNRFVMRDAQGHEGVIYFGTNISQHPDYYAMPPLPPDGEFDVRYATGRMAEFPDSGRSKTVAIRISSAEYPVTIAWKCADNPGSGALLIDGTSVVLRGEGSVHIPSPMSRIQLRLSATVVIEPRSDFALMQNFPNPFNPLTLIRYQLSASSNVVLKVYDILGREVATLVDGFQDAGFKSVGWNASGVATGVYVYRLRAVSASNPNESFTDVKKMIVIR